ncbi:sulfotransferase 1C2-like [Haliotis cracherodii]|uniref:sulfotransferase 1C2-like n=1 Tax=Haliotis cracherodii TaxID=6455 RepID=UPI0039E949E5
MEPNVLHLQDGGGCTLDVQEYEGIYFPKVFSVDVISNFRSMEIRADDVLLSCFPKAGTHWFWEILSQLSARKAENIRDKWKGDMMIECCPQSVLDAAPSPRVLNTHVQFEQLPQQIVEKKCKIVHVLRNPKDLTVSFYNHHRALKDMYNYHGEWKDYLHLFLNGLVDWGSWFDNTLSYIRAKEQNPQLPIQIMYYEDMKQDPVAGVRQLADFLGVEADEELIKGICDKCGFENMKTVASEVGKGLIQDGVPQVFRKGGVGDWKNWFTIAQNEEFDKVYSEKMEGYDLPFKYSI